MSDLALTDCRWSDGQFEAQFQVNSPVIFDLDVQLRALDRNGAERWSRHIRQQGWDIAWLPAGQYQLACRLGRDEPLAAGDRLEVILWTEANGRPRRQHRETLAVTPAQQTGFIHWQLRGVGESPSIDELSWRRGHEDWFFKHFDHAARVIIHLMLQDSPRLQGRVLDVGCGDGITDLGVFLRCQPELLIGVDPFRGFERLPDILTANHLPPQLLDDSRLRFEPADGNDLPYPDNDFDVVLSWGSLEHIAGGYRGTLEEIRRVLKPGGLLFVHPGLYYGSYGNHLGEFFDDPFIHLKLERDELKQRVLDTTPRLMDRAGDAATPDQYWQWFEELNPIRVAEFEHELKALDFEIWRSALRTEPVVDHSDGLQDYSVVDLGVRELYLSCINRKPA